ncbi:MAG: family 20 glycosylhydrolase [Prolixibacteraceae bacterium]
MNNVTFLFVCFCFSIFIGGSSVLGQEHLSLIPQPVEVNSQSGTFSLSVKTRIIISAGNEEVRVVADLFAGQLASLTGQSLEVTTGKAKQSVVFKLNNENNADLGKEGYILQVSPKNIMISANKPAGLFYGAQTLLQLIPPVKVNVPIAVACTEITDYPRFGWRGLMLDVSRHFFTKEEVKRFIDQMVKYKYNTFHWHLTDDNGWRVEIKAYPKLTSVGAWSVARTGRYGSFEPEKPGEPATYGGFYTQDDIREVVKYATDRFVTIVPEVDVPGHSRAVLAAYPEVSCSGKPTTVSAGTRNGIGENVFCVGNEQNFKMLDVIFGELASLFPGDYIHVGGDEANREFWKGCPQCQHRMKEENLKDLPELQSYFSRRVGKIVESKGKKMIGWDEILEGGLAPDATVMSWRGMEGAIAAAKAGHHSVMTPTSFCYFDYLQGEKNIERNSFGFLRAKRVYEFEPVPEGVDPKFILGGQGNVWGEFIPNYRRVEYMTWPRALVLSEILWSPQSERNWDQFVLRMEAQFPRFDQDEVNYATSIYDPEISMVKSDEGDLRIAFTPEIPGLDLYYTFDCTFPDNFSAKYDGQPIQTPPGSSEIWAITYRNGQPVGRLLVITFDELKARM